MNERGAAPGNGAGPDTLDTLVFNGVDGLTGRYLLAADPEDVARLAQGEVVSPRHVSQLAARLRMREATLGVVGTVTDPSDLAQTGWGVIFSADADPAIREALADLLDLRRRQATAEFDHYYREYAGPAGYHLGETAQRFLIRRGASPSGAADPDEMPYYLLLVGDPEAIPYTFQYQLDVQYAVGRLHFDTVEEYAQYARSVVLTEDRNPRPRRATFFGTEHALDRATRLSTAYLVEPLADDAGAWQQRRLAHEPVWEVRRHLRDQATKARLGRIMGGDETPAFLFTASHGAGFPHGHPLQRDHQGALVCSDWAGPRGWQSQPLQDSYVAADDVGADADVLGLVAFHFACNSAGTPGADDYPQMRPGGVSPSGPLGISPAAPIAPRSFVARLAQRLLGHPKGGALAVVGHVERALGSSFVRRTGGPIRSPTTFRSCVRRLLQGQRLGPAIEPFNERYAELCTVLAEEIRQMHSFGKHVDPLELAVMWMGVTDARGYAIFGDPAVRLAIAPDIGPDSP